MICGERAPLASLPMKHSKAFESTSHMTGKIGIKPQLRQLQCSTLYLRVIHPAPFHANERILNSYINNNAIQFLLPKFLPQIKSCEEPHSDCFIICDGSYDSLAISHSELGDTSNFCIAYSKSRSHVIPCNKEKEKMLRLRVPDLEIPGNIHRAEDKTSSRCNL